MSSEYTSMIFQIEAVGKEGVKQKQHGEKGRSIAKQATLVHSVPLGFGNLIATIENHPACCQGPKQPDAFAAIEKAVVGRCIGLCDCCCCMCFIKMCSKINNQCAIALTQLCSGISCFACAECCIELCCDGD